MILCTIAALILGLIVISTPKITAIDHTEPQDRLFWAFNYIQNKYYQVNATLLGRGEYCYVYMDIQCLSSLNQESLPDIIADICHQFDNTIYPRVIDLAGHPNGSMGDIDGDPKIFILFLDSYNYYSELNEIQHDLSNECEMVYINYQMIHHYWLLPTIAHEFHHLIWFNNEWDEPPFTLEALAQYATYHTGYLDSYNNLVPQVSSYLPNPNNSPLYWTDDADYGSTYLFAYYIAEKYGVQILRDLIQEPTDGPQGIEIVLRTAGYNISFNELFLNWITALTIDQTGFENNLYGFLELDAQISNYKVVDTLPMINTSTSINHYAFQVYKVVHPLDNLCITIDKSPEQTLGVVLVIHDDLGWRVTQSIETEDQSTVSTAISGSSPDEVYVIVSYMSPKTPIAPDVQVAGPSSDIRISIEEESRIIPNKPPSSSIPKKNENVDYIDFTTILIALLTWGVLQGRRKFH